VERNKSNRNRGIGLREWVPKGPRSSEQSDDALILSDEMGINGVSEFPRLKLEDENVLMRGGRRQHSTPPEEAELHERGTF
jgi:hypothetical protein